ncbi:ABC transporter substrate-binding protein [Undibacterium arcticum]
MRVIYTSPRHTSLRPMLAALAMALAASAPAMAQAPIKIGFLGELSGPQAAIGKEQYDGLMLLIERNGGKLGGYPVQVIKEDSQLKPDVANQLVRKLVERDKVDIITGVSFSNIMMAVHKYVTDNKVFLVGSNAGPSQIAGSQCSPYQFITSWQGDQTSEAVGKYATDKGYKKVFPAGAELPGWQGHAGRLQAPLQGRSRR